MKRGLLAFSNVNLIAWALGVLLFILFFALGQAYKASYPVVETNALTVKDTITLQALLAYPITPTTIFSDLLVEHFSRIGQGDALAYDVVNLKLHDILGKTQPDQFWEFSILDAKTGYELVSLERKDRTRPLVIRGNPSASVYLGKGPTPEEKKQEEKFKAVAYLPTKHPSYPVIKIVFSTLPLRTP